MARNKKQGQKKSTGKATKRSSLAVGRRPRPTVQESPDAFQIIGYDITDEPLPDPVYERLPESVQDQLDTLHSQLLTGKPRDNLAALQALIEQYPDVPKIYNFLYATYKALGDQSNAERVIQETLERFPDYLFGRTAYAAECLERGEAEKVPEIFEHKYELKLLYPKRECFHISEVLGFYSIIAWYFHAQGDHSVTEQYYEVMRQLDPEHRSTRLVERLLFPSRLSGLLQRLITKQKP